MMALMDKLPRMRTPVKASLAERLAYFSQVNIETGCHEWIGRSTDGRMGYGKLNWRGRAGYAHRFAWELAHGTTIPPRLVVMHQCDNPRCVNPDHLKLGTQLENVADQIVRGRRRVCRGSAHKLSVLSADDISDIRAKSKNGASHAGLGRAYKVSATTVWRIVNHHSYKEEPS